jgi:hypothetical protein
MNSDCQPCRITFLFHSSELFYICSGKSRLDKEEGKNGGPEAQLEGQGRRRKSTPDFPDASLLFPYNSLFFPVLENNSLVGNLF